MRTAAIGAAVLLVFAATVAAQDPSAGSTPVTASSAGHAPAMPAAPAGTKMEFDTYELVLLRRPAMPREFPPEELEKLQQAHLDYMRGLARAGKLVVAGPFGEGSPLNLRGIQLFRVGSADEARRLSEDDPAVKAGRLESLVLTWYTEKGALAFPVAERMAGH
jgi:uncharacterized protein YciI